MPISIRGQIGRLELEKWEKLKFSIQFPMFYKFQWGGDTKKGQISDEKMQTVAYIVRN